MAVEIKIPEVGESVTSGVIAAWVKQDGEWVERDETVLELETDKITMEIPAPAAGILKASAAEGDEVEVGAIVGSVDETAEKPAGAAASAEAAPVAAAAEAAPAKAEAAPAASSNGNSNGNGAAAADAHATPLAKKLAEEHGIDLGSLEGTGPSSRIREQDVLAAMQTRRGGGSGEAPAAPAAAPRSVERKKMTPMRQRIAARLVEAQQTAAMLTTFNEVDLTAVMALRKKYKENFTEKHGVGLGFMSFFVKAAASALEAFPMINAYIVEGEDGSPTIEKHNYYDISIAVSSPKGLVVPVLRGCDTLSFAEVESGIKDLAIRARDGKLGLEELTGGTFTITNGGIFGSMMSTPILNPPQSAILGMHSIKNRPIEDPSNPGQIALRPMMYLALSYDHRIVDGSEAVRFLVHIKDMLEQPERLLINV